MLNIVGHASDGASGQPPRGLQFTLGTNSTAMVDTIVMANLVNIINTLYYKLTMVVKNYFIQCITIVILHFL